MEQPIHESYGFEDEFLSGHYTHLFEQYLLSEVTNIAPTFKSFPGEVPDRATHSTLNVVTIRTHDRRKNLFNLREGYRFGTRRPQHNTDLPPI